MTKVSVITPVYNSSRFIEQSIRSVLDQTYDDLELILVDDCSSDNSASLINDFVKKDSRVRFIQLDVNSGAAVARNRGIEEASGRYLAFLDSDDLWLPEKLEHQVRYMQETGAAFVCSAYERMDEDGANTGEVVRPPLRITHCDLLKSNTIGCLTAMYDAEKLGKVYMPLLRKRQDYGLWLRLLRKVDAVHCLPEVLASYRVRSGSISSNKFEMVKWHWRLFREVEGLSLHRSLYYLGHNIYRKLVQ